MSVIIRLCIMMFLQFFVWGAWYVTAPNFLGSIGFQAEDFGWTYSVGPIAGIIAPLFVGMVADRFFSAQKVLAVMHLVGGGLMFYATTHMTGDAPSADMINIIFFFYMLTYYPTLALTNTVAMKNMTDSAKQFPYIRVFGTIGWIAAGLALTMFKFETTIEMFYLTSGAAVLLGVFSLALPATPPNKEQEISMGQFLGMDAWKLLKDPSYLVFMLCSVLICIPLAFYYQIASRVVEMVELPIGLTMSYGQMSEILFMLLMPFFFARLGVKKMLAVGMLAWAVRYGLFAFGASSQQTMMIIAGVALHGICYDFFFVTGQIYTDQKAAEPIRAQAQGLLVMLTLGIGMFVGAKIAGQLEAHCTPIASIAYQNEGKAKGLEITALETELKATPKDKEKTAALTVLKQEKTDLRIKELKAINWKSLWGFPAIFAGAILVFFVIVFRDDSQPEESETTDAMADGEMTPSYADETVVSYDDGLADDDA